MLDSDCESLLLLSVVAEDIFRLVSGGRMELRPPDMIDCPPDISDLPSSGIALKPVRFSVTEANYMKDVKDIHT
jgi:hypothetical protein